MRLMSVRLFAGRGLSGVLPLCVLLAGGLIVSFISGAAMAHEFWIEPEQYQVDEDATLVAYLRNGEKFGGSTITYIKNNSPRFDVVAGERTDPVVARSGDNPALKMRSLQPGLNVVVHQSAAAVLSYAKWEKFQRFADHKGFENMLERHRVRSLPESHFKEVYTRYSKSLIAVGSGVGSDVQTGLDVELVALQNPYTDDLSEGMKFIAYYQNKVRPNAQIELFEKSPTDEVLITLHQTDEQGEVVLPVKPSHRYLIDMVVLREPAKKLATKKKAVWETLWASLTFAVP